MNSIITKHELWNLPNEQIGELVKGKSVRIYLNNGEPKNIYVSKLLLATNPPNHYVGFITSDDRSIYLMDIDYVELK